MAKVFAPRVSKKQRKTIDLSDRLPRDLLKMSSEQLFRDAKLDTVNLSSIAVKEQVRTKFIDSSIKKLSNNIKQNGLIQPLVLHKERGKLTLICGERRYRAMSLIKMKEAPCFILDSKTKEELLAIQFSENSSREELHYIDKADGILNYQKATDSSERKIQNALGSSKSEVHRSLIIAKLPENIKNAAKEFNIEKYVLLEFEVMDNSPLKKKISKEIIAGKIRKRVDLRSALKFKVGSNKAALESQNGVKISATELMKLLNSKAGANPNDLKLDKKTKALLKSLIS